MKATLLSVAFLFHVSGCAVSGAVATLPDAMEQAHARGFVVGNVEAGGFRLAMLSRPSLVQSDSLMVYIEGDGASWPSPYHPPRDPTPRRPVALSLALADPAPAVVYLGRPCQYLDDEALSLCDAGYWIERRFAPEVVAAYGSALDQLKRSYDARRLKLIGYSGGGVIAALLATRRSDVDALLTVAAPLALGEWVAWHGASPLSGSLDPSMTGKQRSDLHSVHFAGGRDTTVPVLAVKNYVDRIGGALEIVPEFDHECCWARDWPKLLGRSQSMGAE